MFSLGNGQAVEQAQPGVNRRIITAHHTFTMRRWMLEKGQGSNLDELVKKEKDHMSVT
jgi:hypothetical protein